MGQRLSTVSPACDAALKRVALQPSFESFAALFTHHATTVWAHEGFPLQLNRLDALQGRDVFVFDLKHHIEIGGGERLVEAQEG